MWGISKKARVFLYLGSTDMRKSIQALSVLVAKEVGAKSASGDLFAFCNRNMKIIKILYWDRNGFCLWQKKLESNHFKWPCNDRELQEVNQEVLGWLLDGLDIRHAHARLDLPLAI